MQSIIITYIVSVGLLKIVINFYFKIISRDVKG